MFSDIPTSERWGPFVADLDPAERLARTRLLRGLCHVLTGQRGAWACLMLSHAETDVSALRHALDALNDLGSRDLRRVVAAFGAVSCPRWQR
jgi:hypothetical protein